MVETFQYAEENEPISVPGGRLSRSLAEYMRLTFFSALLRRRK